MLDDDLRQQLIKAARRAREAAYAPYSGDFKVGSAVLSTQGEILSGCNIENASFGATICAERVALATAVAAGHRKFKAQAIIADTPEPIKPCGLCRQVMAEFCPDGEVIMANMAGSWQVVNVRQLLPDEFKFPPAGKARAPEQEE